MKIEYVSKNESRRLILIFAGWGMDARPFEDLHHPGYDIAVVYDYRTIDLPESTDLDQYDEICVVAWSFGVASANIFLAEHPTLPVTARVAVNGTLTPVDDQTGIPTKTFQATLNALSAETLRRFNRRMCGSATAAATFDRHAPKRTIEELAEELREIADRPVASDPSRWDTIYISNHDLIIPTANQQAAWYGHHDIRTIEGAHLPDFERLIASRFINKPLVAHRFNKANHTYNLNACVQAEIATRLVEAIVEISPKADNVLEIGAGTGLLTLPLERELHPRDLTLWDIAAINPALPGHHRICDAESEMRTVAPDSFDLIVSASTLQWFNSPVEFIRCSANALRHDGVIAFSTFDPLNFNEIASFLPAPLHYLPAEQWREILKSFGFREANIESKKRTLEFESPQELLRHIRQTGVNALPPSPLAARRIIYSDIKKLTYSPLIITARK